MQSESVTKVLFSDTWQAFQPAVFCRVFNTMSSLTYTLWSFILLLWEDCICYAVTIYTSTVSAPLQLVHITRDAREVEFLQHCSPLKNTIFWECILHFLDREVAVKWNRTLFLKRRQNSTREFCIVEVSQFWCLLGLHCRTESVKGMAIPWVELVWIYRQIDRAKDCSC